MRLATIAIALYIALASAPAAAQPAPASDAQSLFVIRYRPGPAWIAGRPVHQQNLREHGIYIRGLLELGRLFAGGGFTDADGGMAIVWAADRAGAEAILAADPAQRDGIMIGEITGWMPRFVSPRPLIERN